MGTQSCAETYQDVIIEGGCHDSTEQGKIEDVLEKYDELCPVDFPIIEQK